MAESGLSAAAPDQQLRTKPERMSVVSEQRRAVCGLCIHICSDFERAAMNYGALAARCVQHNAEHDAVKMSTLVPASAEVVTLITTETDSFILFPADDSDDVFYATPLFQARPAMGANTVVHGWLYTDKRAVVHIGVFDATRVRGVELRELPPLERHSAVHALLHKFGCEHRIHYHWSGYESHCMRPFHHGKLDYAIGGIARLSPDMGAPSVVRVLACLLTGAGDLETRRRR